MPSAEPEKELLARACAGDLEAFEVLYRHTFKVLYWHCFRLTGHESDASELMQETYLRGWQKLHQFRGESTFLSWLKRLSINLHIDSLRAKNAVVWLCSDSLQDHEPGLDESCNVAEMDLQKAIADLPDGARQVLVMHDIEGYTHQEIAKITKLAVGTSKAQLSRARQLLRQKLLGRKHGA